MRTPFRARVVAEPALQGTDQRGGFALITVLWLITALSAVVGLSLATTRLGQRTTKNRVALTRGRWAAEACLAIAQARWAQQGLADTASIDLGRGTTCRWRVEDPTAEPNDDPGTINVNAAGRETLRGLPGLGAEAADRILWRQALGRPVRSLDEVAGDLSPGARAVLLANYADLARLVTFSAPRLQITADGWVAGDAPRATIEILTVPLPDRLAVIRRRMW